MEICRGCESYDTDGKGCSVPGTAPCCSELSGGCGCSLSLKGRSPSSSCPKNKWLAVMNEQEEELLKANLHDKAR
jgi:hypothetical protein